MGKYFDRQQNISVDNVNFELLDVRLFFHTFAILYFSTSLLASVFENCADQSGDFHALPATKSLKIISLGVK